MRVAIVHYWLLNMRGGEKVVESLCRMYPDADIYTHICDPDALSDTLRRHTIRESFIARLPGARRLYQKYLPFMPAALEALDLTAYDLVISSESGPAKGVITAPHALHLCYCHSPMRYLWDQYHVYRAQAGRLSRWMMPLISPSLRRWDVTSAARVDLIVANSHYIRRRVRKFWRRDARVVHPPVFVDDFAPVAADAVEDFYLWVGELVSYKRADIMVEAFRRSGRRLVVIGGPDSAVKALSKGAPDTITFLGKTDFATLKSHMARCRALIFPGEEDFGIVPVEVMASGRPVIAFGRGGALDTVVEGVTGTFFDEPTVEGLEAAIARFEADILPNIDPDAIVAHSRDFGEARFQDEFRTAVADGFKALEAAA